MNSQEQPSLIHYAMNFGAVMGVYYIVKFCLFPMSLSSTFAGMLFIVLTLMVPLLMYRLTIIYRDRYMHGKGMTFAHALAFAMLTMSFGSLLVSVAHYVYFAFIDGGAMVNALEQSIEQMSELLATEEIAQESIAQGATIDEYIGMLHTTAAQIRALTPIDMTISMLSSNLSWSVIVALPVAALISLRKHKQKTS